MILSMIASCFSAPGVKARPHLTPFGGEVLGRLIEGLTEPWRDDDPVARTSEARS